MRAVSDFGFTVIPLLVAVVLAAALQLFPTSPPLIEPVAAQLRSGPMLHALPAADYNAAYFDPKPIQALTTAVLSLPPGALENVKGR